MELKELGTILHIEKGRKPKAQSGKFVEGYLPYVDIKAFEQGIIDSYATTDKSLLCEDGDLLIVCDGSRSGLTGKAMKGVVGSTLSKIYADGLTTEYLRYFIQSKYTLLNTQKKGTGTPHLNVAILKESKLIVPSIDEQNRIVGRIEELFSELDKAVETLQTVKQQLAVYRQAVLKEAFYSNCLNIQYLKIIEFASVETGATPLTTKREYYNNGTVPWITSTSVNSTFINKPNELITELALKETNCKVFPIHTLIIAMYGEGKTRGKCSELLIEAATNQAVAAIILNDNSPITRNYLKWFMTLNYYGLRRKSSGGVQPNLNLRIIKNYLIPLCSIHKQEQIVTEIESRLSVCDNIEQSVNTVLAQAGSMRQSILKEAFEGRLL